MRRLIVIVLVLATLWGGYWFVGRAALEKGVAAAFATARAEGRVAGYSDLSVTGFPNRFDMTLSDLVLGDPATGTGWRGEFVKVLALSYLPTHVIVLLPREQKITLPGDELTLMSGLMEGSVVFVTGTDLALDRTAFIANDAALTSASGWQAGLGRLRFATQRRPDAPNAHEIGLDISALAPDAALRALIDPEDLLPPALDDVYLDAEAQFSAPLDRHAGESRPRLTRLTVKDGHATWGPLGLSVTGAVAIGSDGAPSGRLNLRAKNWRALLDMAVRAGFVRAEVRPTWEEALARLATAGSAGPDTVELPLVFENGFMSFGPLPLGPAPKLR